MQMFRLLKNELQKQFLSFDYAMQMPWNEELDGRMVKYLLLLSVVKCT